MTGRELIEEIKMCDLLDAEVQIVAHGKEFTITEVSFDELDGPVWLSAEEL